MHNHLRLFTNPPADMPPVGCVDILFDAATSAVSTRDAAGTLTPFSGDSVASSGGTATNLTINGITEGYGFAGTGLDNTVGVAATLDISAASILSAKLTDATTTVFTMPEKTLGKSFTLLLRQSEPTGNGIATFTGVKWDATGAPTITATPGKQDILTFITDGTYWYGSYTQGYDYPT